MPTLTMWTHEQIQALIPRLKRSMDEEAAEQGKGDGGHEAKGLPPMEFDECRDLLLRLVESAKDRQLTRQEVFLHGQLLCQFEMAVLAKHRGLKGRYLVVPESKINEMMAGRAERQ